MSAESAYRVPAAPVDPRGTVLFGLAVVCLSLGGLVLWSALAPLAEAVVATGTVKVDSSRKKVQHLEGGIVEEILVRDGDRVAKGEVLVRLDETRAAASLAILRDSHDTALAQEARLLAERDDLDGVAFPLTLLERAGESKVAGILKSQTVLWEARRSALDGEVQILKKQITRLRGDIDGYRAQLDAKQRQLAFLREELESLRDLQARRLSGKQRVLELEREAAELEGELAEQRSALAAAETEISRRELEIFQVGKSFRQGVVDELKQVQAEILDLRERLNAAEHVHAQTEVRAPVDGVIVGSGVHTIGGVVSPGETLLELVPANDKLVVEARVDPGDIDKVAPGLPAGIRLTAFNQRTTPELAGSLQYVSADVLQDPNDQVAYFLARIDVPKVEIERLGEKRLQPGMMAEVFIRTGERTMVEYLLQPLRDSFRRAWLED